MKKILIILFIILVVYALVGCTPQDYLDNREQFIQDCNADPICKQAIIDDADDLIKRTPVYIALQDDMILVQNNLITTQTELDIAENTIIDLQTQIDTNANNIQEIDTRLTDLEYRVKTLESITDGNSLTNIYQKTLNIHNLVTMNKKDLDDVKIYIHLTQAIDMGYSKQQIKQNLKIYLWEDLSNIIDKDKVTIIIYEDGMEDEEYILTDLMP